MTTAPAPTTDPSADPVAPSPDFAEGADTCAASAVGPWASIASVQDPLVVLRSGRLPPLLGGKDGTPLDQLTDLPTIDDYRDPSTLDSPRDVYDAFAAAGYRDGAEARYQHGQEKTVVTMVRFADAASAGDALRAHLTDYCTHAIESKVRPGRDGMVVLRDRGTVRTLFVVGDVEVSLMVCGCFGATDALREEGVEQWSRQLEATVHIPPADDRTA